jgi:cysteinyl-tRNA synthetase
MILLIQDLLRKGYAYQAADKCIYYSIRKFRKYGELAGIKVGALQAGASGRILKDEYEKEQVADFALWKAWDPEDGDVAWESPFGKGRPGWHIECSAMSAKHLTGVFQHGYDPKAFVTLDIHTGGEDNMFPHHQDEIAQSEGCFGKRFVKHWLHSAHLLVDGKKMSKSLGNFYTLRDLLAKGYDPVAIRYVLLSTHYRQQVNFTLAGIDAAKAALQRLQDFILALKAAQGGTDNPRIPKLIATCRKAFEKAMDNDLDISPALAAIFALVKDVNVISERKPLSRADADAVLSLLRELDTVLGVLRFEDDTLTPALQKLIDDREEARKRRDWAAADRLRDELARAGIIIEDTPQGPRWKRAR